MEVRNRLHLAPLAATVAMLLCSGAGAYATPSVTVNGNPVTFRGPPPMEIDGSVLVPLRGVFEAMGGSVDYNSVDRMITAKKGSAVVMLSQGAAQATVNGHAQALSHPAIVANGATFVPLRFVAQALGGYVEWHAAQNLVTITTQDSHLAQLPSSPGAGQITGQLTGIYTKTNPQQITLRYNGQNTTIPITGKTVILRAQSGQTDRHVTIGDIRVGDQVIVERDDMGYAGSITVTDGLLTGTVKTIERTLDGSHVLTFNDGSKVTLAPNVIVQMSGRRIDLSNVQTDEYVQVRTNAGDGRGYEVILDNRSIYAHRRQ